MTERNKTDASGILQIVIRQIQVKNLSELSFHIHQFSKKFSKSKMTNI